MCKHSLYHQVSVVLKIAKLDFAPANHCVGSVAVVVVVEAAVVDHGGQVWVLVLRIDVSNFKYF